MKKAGPRRNRNRFLRLFVPVLSILSINLLGEEELESVPEDFPWLHTMEVGEWPTTYKTNEQIVRTGKPLRQIDFGLHSLEEGQEANPTVLIGIHGFKARGFEWVYPLLTMDTDSIHTHYFRWDFLDKNSKARTMLLDDISDLIDERTAPLERIVIVAHSCGGVMVTAAIEDLPEDVNFDIHTVASPLNGLGLFTVCRPDLPESLPDHVTLTQWRTAKEKDSVFWWFPRDPQKVTKDYGVTIELPKKYHGIRLGHVRSLSWVSERIFSDGLLSESSSTEQLVESETSESPSLPVSD
ncbi:MAG: alpha/beta hydrolase [Gammaproteobacteria bacterium]|nr:alpha/beta hydrolase [Gammaproteobacteria bacterium]MYF38699.1 alpha/beta hydrolase [Gammaproteobacteria bacterium]